MKFAVYGFGGSTFVGALAPDGQSVSPFDLPASDAKSGILALIDRGDADLPLPGSPIPLAGVRLLAPVPRPRRNIFCVGKNYHEHAHEFAKSGFDSSAASGAVPDHPIIFSKVPQCVTGPGDAIVIDHSVSDSIDYEAELAIIISKSGRNIPKARAMDHVWGYTIVNDVTARDLQNRHKQWLIGKSQDTFCPMGPFAVTADEIDLRNTIVTSHVNGELRQNASTSLLIFDVPTLIATISNGLTLVPGDIIATGTPAGVGIGFNPPKFLKDGDVVRVEISGIGTLENPVQARAA